MTQPDSSATSPRTLVRVLVASAVVTVVLAVVLGALVAPFLYAIALLAIVDLWLARGYATGRFALGQDPRLARTAEGGVAPGDSTEAVDPSYNPYARED